MKRLSVFLLIFVMLAALCACGSASVSRSSSESVDSESKSDDKTKCVNLITSSEVSEGDIVLFGSYEQDMKASNGKEPIEWYVLKKDHRNLMLITKYGLDCQMYNKKEKSVTWENCSIRKWLNGKFFEKAFSTSDQNRIRKTTVKNPDTYYGQTSDGKYAYTNTESDLASISKTIWGGDAVTKGGETTFDKVFLLSVDELRELMSDPASSKKKDKDKEKDYTSMRAAATPAAVELGVKEDKSYLTSQYEPCSRWWLRSTGSSGSDSKNALVVKTNGEVGSTSLCDNSTAVRPVVWVTLAS